MYNKNSPVPASLLRKMARVYSRAEGYTGAELAEDVETAWSGPLKDLGIQLIRWSGHEQDVPEAPEVIWDQLEREVLRAGITVEHEGRSLMLVFYVNDAPGSLGDPIVRSVTGEYFLVFAPADCIDLNS